MASGLLLLQWWRLNRRSFSAHHLQSRPAYRLHINSEAIDEIWYDKVRCCAMPAHACHYYSPPQLKKYAGFYLWWIIAFDFRWKPDSPKYDTHMLFRWNIGRAHGFAMMAFPPTPRWRRNPLNGISIVPPAGSESRHRLRHSSKCLYLVAGRPRIT